MIKKFFITTAVFLLLPFATWWLWYQEKAALRLGRKLSDEEIILAKKIGIEQPEKIRIYLVDRVPTPVPRFIENMLQKRGFPAGNAAGMSMRYGIYVQAKFSHSKSLIAHELVHTHQYERFGSLSKFLRVYLQETMLLGYIHSPLEKEANTTSETILKNESTT